MEKCNCNKFENYTCIKHCDCTETYTCFTHRPDYNYGYPQLEHFYLEKQESMTIEQIKEIIKNKIFN